MAEVLSAGAGSAAKRMALTRTSVTCPLFRAFRNAVRPGHPAAERPCFAGRLVDTIV